MPSSTAAPPAPAPPAPARSPPYVRILWNVGTLGDWQRLWQRLPRSTLPQSFAYGQAMLLTERARPRLGLIEADEEPIGMVQALESRLLGLIPVTRIERGPLFLAETPAPAVVEASYRALRQAYPAGVLRWTTLIPELPATAESAAMLARTGFRRIGPGYRTLWLSLDPTEAALRRGLEANWRNHLNRAERAGLTVDIDPEARLLPWLIGRYLEDRALKRYRGPGGKLVVRLRNALYRADGVWLLRAVLDGDPVAAVLLLRHGTTATYQIGWSGVEGRRTQAHSLLLWRGLLAARAAGTKWLDLGGIHPEAAPGVTRFKRGLGGTEAELPGIYA